MYKSDSKRLKQILINLLSNSLKFTERGSITIKVSKHINQDETYLKFKVIDTGVGIVKQDISKIFKKAFYSFINQIHIKNIYLKIIIIYSLFEMSDKHRENLNKTGTGLGLSISKKIVESLGGTISVTSQEGRLTEFKFTIKIVNDARNIEESKQNVLRGEEVYDISII